MLYSDPITFCLSPHRTHPFASYIVFFFNFVTKTYPNYWSQFHKTARRRQNSNWESETETDFSNCDRRKSVASSHSIWFWCDRPDCDGPCVWAATWFVSRIFVMFVRKANKLCVPSSQLPILQYNYGNSIKTSAIIEWNAKAFLINHANRFPIYVLDVELFNFSLLTCTLFRSFIYFGSNGNDNITLYEFIRTDNFFFFLLVVCSDWVKSTLTFNRERTGAYLIVASVNCDCGLRFTWSSACTWFTEILLNLRLKRKIIKETTK